MMAHSKTDNEKERNGYAEAVVFLLDMTNPGNVLGPTRRDGLGEMQGNQKAEEPPSFVPHEEPTRCHAYKNVCIFSNFEDLIYHMTNNKTFYTNPIYRLLVCDGNSQC